MSISLPLSARVATTEDEVIECLGPNYGGPFMAGKFNGYIFQFLRPANARGDIIEG